MNIDMSIQQRQIDIFDSSALVASVDFRLVDSSGSAPVKVECPSGFRIRNASITSTLLILE